MNTNLTKMEKDILSVFEDNAISTRLVYVKNILRIFMKNLSSPLGESSTIISRLDDLIDKKEIPENYFHSSITNKELLFALKFEAIKPKIKQKMLENDDFTQEQLEYLRKQEIVVESPYTLLSETEKIKIYEKLLRLLKIKFPSYFKVYGTLEILKDLKYIEKRQDTKTNKKADFLWYINKK